MAPHTRARAGDLSTSKQPQEPQLQQKTGGIEGGKQGNRTEKNQYVLVKIMEFHPSFLATCCLGPTRLARQQNPTSSYNSHFTKVRLVGIHLIAKVDAKLTFTLVCVSYLCKSKPSSSQTPGMITAIRISCQGSGAEEWSSQFPHLQHLLS